MGDADRCVPDFATHYHLAEKEPFLNLSDLDEAGLPAVMKDLERRRAAAGLRRVFGSRYMELRRLTEHRLRELFLSVGGRPARSAPHYLVLGKSEWFRGLSPGMSEIVVHLTDLPPSVTSFTYPDSFTSMGFGPRFGLPESPRPYHGRVYRMEELDGIVSDYGLPTDGGGYDGYEHEPFEKYIEIQVWSDEPISPLVDDWRERVARRGRGRDRSDVQ